MASFYVQVSEEEMSDELVFGSEAYQEMVDAGALTDETMVWAEHLDGWTAWAEVKGSEYIVSGGEAGGADGDDGDDDGDGSTACTSLYYEGCDDEVGLADLAELVEAGTIDDETMVYSDQDGFPYDDWVAWEYVSYLWGHGEEPNEAGGECTTLYYEGCDDEVDLEQLAALVEDGTIVDETMVYSDQDGFPFEGWTAWEECSYLFGMGSERCTALYYEGCDDEVDLEQLAALVEDGTITALTLVYSDQPAFPFEGWTAWEECSYLFGVGEAPEGGCTTLVYEVDDEASDEVDATAFVELLASGTVDAETLVYSTDAGFTFDGWTAWRECKHLFSAPPEEEEEGVPAEAAAVAEGDPSGVAAAQRVEGEVDESEQAERAMREQQAADQLLREQAAAEKAREEAEAKAAAEAVQAEARAAAEAAKKAAEEEKERQLAAIKAKQEAKQREAEEAAKAEQAADRAGAEAAGLAPVALEIPDAEMEALPDSDFEEYFKMAKAKFKALPPFRVPMVRKAAQARYKEAMEARNRQTAMEWAGVKKAREQAIEDEAHKRVAMGEEIAKKGFGALLGGAAKALEPTAAKCGKLTDVSASRERYCMVWPGVRVPNVPAGDHFLFIYASAKEKKPSKVLHLHPGRYTLKTKNLKNKAATAGLVLEAPLVSSGSGVGKPAKVVLACATKGDRQQWLDCFGSADVREDEAQALVQGEGDLISAFDFDVKMPAGSKGKPATLTVTREHVKVLQNGKTLVDVLLKDVKSWAVASTSIGFKMIRGTDISIGTTDSTQAQAIKDAMITQAKGMIQARKDAKAAEAAAKAAAEKAAKEAEAAAEAEKLEWLTYEELKNGTYDARPVNLKMGPVDEKNKERWLRDEDFVKIFGMTKEEFAAKPAFQRPMLKKKRGLGPGQFLEGK